MGEFMSLSKIPASIELSPKQIFDCENLEELMPAFTHVYIPDLGVETADSMVDASKRLTEAGYLPVPHFAARRITTKAVLELRIKRLTEEADIKDVLIIGGGLPVPNGDFVSSLALLETGLFDKYGIRNIGVAGHPEGSPDFNDDTALEILQLKQNLANRSDANFRIVTQFGFDAVRFINWAKHIKATGIDLPVHMGVAGPAKITTLIKFAAMCGIGNSMEFLKKRSSAIMTLASGFNPEDIVAPIEQHWLSDQNSLSSIEQIHVFPFGGIKKSSAWLKERGTWGAESVQCDKHMVAAC
jgi:methylenetetrahydrofolate reductase (NADPH)